MSKKCLDCAKRQQIKGWRVAREAYSVLWPILINNKAATLELSENQIQGLLDVTEEMTSIICGAEESGMNVADYAEYITGKRVFKTSNEAETAMAKAKEAAHE